MMALIALARMIPAWAYGVIVGVALAIALMMHERGVGAAGVRAEWASADARARIVRAEQIRKLGIQQVATAAAIQGKYDDEIASVRGQLRAAGRMRLPAFCQPTAATAGPSSAQGSIDASAGAGLVPERVQADFEALILAAEGAAASARAAQEFIRANGMAN